MGVIGEIQLMVSFLTVAEDLEIGRILPQKVLLMELGAR